MVLTNLLLHPDRIPRYTFPMNRRFPTLIADGIIILSCVLALVLITQATTATGGGYVQIQSHDSTYRYSLDQDREIVVDGPLGETRIVIEDHAARIVDSACPTKSCTQQKPIKSPNAWIACLPNQVLLTIVGQQENQSEVDDVAN